MTVARVDTTQSKVVSAIVDLLITNVPNLTDKTCFLSLYPDPPAALSDNLWITVSIWSGTFPPEFQDGGGAHQVTEDAGVLVKVFSRMKTDRVGHDVNALIDEARGLLTIKGQVIRALAGQDPLFERNLILRDLIKIKSATAPEKSSEFDGFTEISILISTVFDHDCTS